MRWLWIVFLFVRPLCGAVADIGAQVLAHVSQNVAARIRQSANYTCVQTIDQTYFVSKQKVQSSCCIAPDAPNRKEIMHDRLRLDVAVSEDREIYSWHGKNRFVSSKISDVVGTGAISAVTPSRTLDQLRSVYVGRIPQLIMEQRAGGVFIVRSRRLRLDNHFPLTGRRENPSKKPRMPISVE